MSDSAPPVARSASVPGFPRLCRCPVPYTKQRTSAWSGNTRSSAMECVARRRLTGRRASYGGGQ